MPLFTWKPEYSVNDKELDSHHQRLFNIINTVYTNVVTSPQIGSILPMLDELMSYTEYHFSTEELYMRKKGFSGIDEHIAMHREFANKLESLRKSYSDNDLDVSGDLIIILGEWLLHHVIREDGKYSGL
jgi:hemerythrin-like metal-binding protein